MLKRLALAFAFFGVIAAQAQGLPPVFQTGVVSHAVTGALAASLSAKAAPGNLMGYNCSSITGGAGGFCVVVNSATTPTNGASITPLDFCSFDTTGRGCSLFRGPAEVFYNAGIQVLVTTAASPFTFTSGTDTAAISADFQ